MIKRFGIVLIGLVALLGPGVAMASSASASTGTVRTTPDATTASRTFCVNGGNYCMTVTFRSVSGGIFIDRIDSAGRTVGSGCAREYVVVNGTYTRATNRICYRGGVVIQGHHIINAKASCGTTVLVDWRGTNAPAGRPGFKVVC
jgi:hypothetical protein